ncbi:hypothetical protein DPV78_011724 [Talaromyces pinophilus]|nr:hypothetical protein DPV78_011724 [Talaromyces pinophilus]
MATANATWPAISLPSGAAELIDLFFSLTELKIPDAGRQLPDEVFIPSGQFAAPHGTSTGSEEIAKSREHAWDAIDARQHEI